MQNIILAVIGMILATVSMYKITPSVEKYIQSNKVDSLIQKEQQIYDAAKRYITTTGSIPLNIEVLETAGYLPADLADDNGWGQPITLSTTTTQTNGQIAINTTIPNAYAKTVYLRSFKKTFTATNPSGDDTISSFVLPIDVLHGNSGGVLSGAIASATAPTGELIKYWYDTSDTTKGAILKVKDTTNGTWVPIATNNMLPRVSSTNTVAAVGSLPTTDVSDGDIRYVYNSTSGAVDTYVYYGTGWQKYLSGGGATLTACYGQYYKCSDITTTGLVAYYPLTGTADNLAGTTYHGTESFVVYANDGTKGAVASFTGSGSFVDLNLDNAVSGTLNFWMYVPAQVTASSAYKMVGMPNRKNSYNWICTGDGFGSYSETLSFYSYDISVAWYIQDTIPVGWHMVTTFWDGSNWKIYLDGVSKTVYYNATAPTNITFDPIFGRRDYNDNAFFNGKISNVRIYNRALSASEITTIYDTESTKHPIVVDSGLLAYYPLGRNSHDNYYNQYNGTDSGGFVYDGKSASFDGTNDSIDTAVNLSNSAFTVSFWTKDLSKDIYTIASSSGSTKSGLIIQPTGTQGNINFRLQNTSTDYFNFSALLDKTTWQHIVMSFDNSTNTNGAKIYINGVLKSQATATGLNNFTHSYTIDLMKDPSSTSYYQGGKLSHVRFYNKAITADDVKSIYDNEKGEVQ